MTELPEYIDRPEKDDLKQRLPLAYACARLGIQFGQNGKALCPFHDDSDPSFGLWTGESGEVLWSCFPCGLTGDIYSLIMRLHSCSFPEAIETAANILSELPDDYVPPLVEAMPRDTERDRENIELQVKAARDLAARTDHAGIMAARVGFAPLSQPELCARWDKYLRKTWGWGINPLGEIFMPHWDADGVLTGAKKRQPSGKKDSIKGSVYASLYGSWLARSSKDVILLEGESDCVYARWIALEEGVNIDTYALPSGANDEVKPEWIKFLRHSGTIYLALDPDAVGVEATWRWIAALTAADVENFKICSLPLGRDLRSAQPTMSNLLASAREAIPQPRGIAADRGRYTKPGKIDDVPVPITNWVVEPIAQLVGGEPGYDVTLHYRGTKRRTVIRLSDLSTTREIKRWCNRHSLIFTGREDDLQRIAEYVLWRGSVTPEIYQTDQVGRQNPPAAYAFAGPSVVFPDGYVGKLPWRYVPTATTTDVSGKILLPAEGAFNWRWLEQFLTLSSSTVTHPLIAWIVASARRSEVTQFPLLFISGSSGVGKSTLARLALRMAGSKIEIDLSAITPFILLRTLAVSTSIPVFIDEWTRISRRDSREAFQGTIPALYTGSTAERGQADLSSSIYRLTSPVIVAGEDMFSLDREIERMVAIAPTRAAQNHEVLKQLSDKPLERFGQVLQRWLTTDPRLPKLETIESSRVDHNRQILEVGWSTLRALLHEAGRFEDVPEIPLKPDLSSLNSVLMSDDENVYDQALLVGMSMTDNDRHPVVWRDVDGRGTWARFQVLTGLIQNRSVDIALPGGSRSMKAYFEERFGKLELGPSITPPGHFTGLRAWLIPNYDLPGEPDPRSTWIR